MRISSTFALAILGLVVNIDALAQSLPHACDSVLIQRNVVRQNSTEKERMAYLDIVTSENYETARTYADASLASYFSGSYEQFQQRRNTFFQSRNYNFSKDEARNLSSSTLPADAVDAWRDCIRQHSQGRGLLSWVEDISPESVTLIVRWDPAVGLENLEITNADINGITDTPTITGTRGRGESSYVLIRQPNTEIRGAINGRTGNGQYNSRFYVPAPAPRPQTTTTSREYTLLRDDHPEPSNDPTIEDIGGDLKIHYYDFMNDRAGLKIYSSDFQPRQEIVLRHNIPQTILVEQQEIRMTLLNHSASSCRVRIEMTPRN